MHKEIREVLNYFAFFSYPPKEDEIYTFLSIKAEKGHFCGRLKLLVIQKKLVKKTINGEDRYTLPEHVEFYKIYKSRVKESERKVKKVKLYFKMLSLIPAVKFAGFSGSIALNNADTQSDIDLFIITSANWMWTARFFSIVLAHIFNLRDEKLPHRVCLNLFFDEQQLEVPKCKRNKYVAHEILQMKTIFNKRNTYRCFLGENKWVAEYFPNATADAESSAKTSTLRPWNNLLTNGLEVVLKKIQLNIILRRLREEKITKNQLWLFTEDFEKKLPKKLVE